MSIELDCGDNSCIFATDKKGMRTNGGCRCIPPGQSKLSLKCQQMVQEITRLKAQLEIANAKAEHLYQDLVGLNMEYARLTKEVERHKENLQQIIWERDDLLDLCQKHKNENATLREKVEKALKWLEMTEHTYSRGILNYSESIKQILKETK
jgi:septal ring factor EnvC (AmiA/AmiB activator)